MAGKIKFWEGVRLSRTERYSYSVLTVILLLGIAVVYGMRYFVAPPKAQPDPHFKAAWSSLRKADPPASRHPAWTKDTINYQAELRPFDPNTADSPTLIALGFTPRLAHGLINWRNHGKQFYKKEELKRLYNMPDAFYSRLEPFIQIDPRSVGGNSGYKDFGSWPGRKPPPTTIELNTVDSATLESLYGIGPFLAHKIIERRRALGGFLNKDQLKEVYGLRDSTLAMLQAMSTINPANIHRMNLNTVTLAQLKAHPYIGEKLGQFILLYRDGLGTYTSLDQLRQAPTMDEAKFRKIAPYFKVEP